MTEEAKEPEPPDERKQRVLSEFIVLLEIDARKFCLKNTTQNELLESFRTHFPEFVSATSREFARNRLSSELNQISENADELLKVFPSEDEYNEDFDDVVNQILFAFARALRLKFEVHRLAVVIVRILSTAAEIYPKQVYKLRLDLKAVNERKFWEEDGNGNEREEVAPCDQFGHHYRYFFSVKMDKIIERAEFSLKRSINTIEPRPKRIVMNCGEQRRKLLEIPTDVLGHFVMAKYCSLTDVIESFMFVCKAFHESALKCFKSMRVDEYDVPKTSWFAKRFKAPSYCGLIAVMFANNAIVKHRYGDYGYSDGTVGYSTYTNYLHVDRILGIIIEQHKQDPKGFTRILKVLCRQDIKMWFEVLQKSIADCILLHKKNENHKIQSLACKEIRKILQYKSWEDSDSRDIVRRMFDYGNNFPWKRRDLILRIQVPIDFIVSFVMSLRTNKIPTFEEVILHLLREGNRQRRIKVAKVLFYLLEHELYEFGKRDEILKALEPAKNDIGTYFTKEDLILLESRLGRKV